MRLLTILGRFYLGSSIWISAFSPLILGSRNCFSDLLAQLRLLAVLANILTYMISIPSRLLTVYP